ncbi:hypothetical protein NQ318_023298 [Aromia moschata]|uniref:Uncharacterized protein n=1 Tax=Aromia moschata TaxID=1265417 RepID=A0AAV8XS83_9CUCU|nr:hypothetical protein NQ318_023298 [Aromia moschata]
MWVCFRLLLLRGSPGCFIFLYMYIKKRGTMGDYSVDQEVDNIQNVIMKYAPEYWEKNYMDPSTRIKLHSTSEEFDEVSSCVGQAVRQKNLRIISIKRYQNIFDFGQYIIREQLMAMANPKSTYYRVRRFITVKSFQLDRALEYNLDPRRCDITSLVFRKQVLCAFDDILLVVQVLTDRPKASEITPINSTEYFIEYIIEISTRKDEKLVDNMQNVITKYAPEHWEKNYTDPSTKFPLHPTSEEFNEISSCVRQAVRQSNLRIISIKRYQNIFDSGQYITKEQLLATANPESTYYRVRRFITIKSHYLNTALEYNLDPRRCGKASLVFRNQISSCASDDVVLVVQVITKQPNASKITPNNSSEYFIDYIVEM